MTTKAKVVLQDRADGPLELVEVELPDPEPHQVVVSLLASGVCHSQLKAMRAPRQAPLLLGHEGYGVVVATGAEVSRVRDGSHVVVTWVPLVEEGRSRRPEHSSLTLADGRLARSPNVFTWGDHTVVDELFAVPVPDTYRRDSVAIVGCAVVTGVGAVCNAAAVQPGETTAVFGIGGVGLSAVFGARMARAGAVVAVDVVDAKLGLARHFGATETLNASREDPVARIRDLFPGEGQTNGLAPVAGVDYAFDCVGLPVTIEQALASVRPGWFGRRRGGTAVLVGVPDQAVCLDSRELLGGDKTFLAALGGSCHQSELERYLQWAAAGELDLDAMVTDRFPLDRLTDAVEALDGGRILGRALALV